MVESLEKKGIHFEVKEIRNGVLTDAKARNKRKNRNAPQSELEKENSAYY